MADEDYEGLTEDQVNDWNIHNDHTDDDYANALPPWACEECGAEPGEPCRPGCKYLVEAADMELAADAADEAQAEADAWLVDHAQGALMGVVYRLPYSGLLDDPPSREGIDGDVWLAKLAVWMEKYRALLAKQVAEMEAGYKRAIALQLEKDVVRGFLIGTGGSNGGGGGA